MGSAAGRIDVSPNLAENADPSQFQEFLGFKTIRFEPLTKSSDRILKLMVKGTIKDH